MKIVYIASANPVKVKATREGFLRMFPTEHFEFRTARSTAIISSQPMSDEETLDGATRRAENIRAQNLGGDFWVGIEGGVSDKPAGMGAFAWVVVLSQDRTGRGRSGEFFLPQTVADLVRHGWNWGKRTTEFFLETIPNTLTGRSGCSPTMWWTGPTFTYRR